MTPKHLSLVACAAILALTAQTQAYSFVNDFSNTNGNPNGAWTYGHSTTFGALTAFSTASTDANFASWSSPDVFGANQPPGLGKNISAGTLGGILAGEVGLHPGNGVLAVARLAVASTGVYNIAGTFGAGDSGSVDVWVLVNGVSNFSALGTAGDASFNFTTTVNLGDSIDFVVGMNYDYYYDSTPLSATVTPVPEPATLGLVAACSWMVARRRRRADSA